MKKFRRIPKDVVLAYFIPTQVLRKPHSDLQRVYRALRAGNAWIHLDPLPVISVWWWVSWAQICLIIIEQFLPLNSVRVLSTAFSIATCGLAFSVLWRFWCLHSHEAPSQSEEKNLQLLKNETAESLGPKEASA